MQHEAERLVKTYVDIANRLYDLDLPMPEIKDNLRDYLHPASFHSVPEGFYGKGDGYHWAPWRHIITLNKFYYEQAPNYLEEIIPHEIAHFVVRMMYKEHKKPHGKEWQEIMVAFGREPNRTCNCDVHGLPPPVWKRYYYNCECGNILRFTRIVARRILKGQKSIACADCKKAVKPEMLEADLRMWGSLDEIIRNS